MQVYRRVIVWVNPWSSVPALTCDSALIQILLQKRENESIKIIQQWVDIYINCQLSVMQGYQSLAQAALIPPNSTSMSTPPEKYLKNVLALTLIRSTINTCRLRLLAFSYKQIQFSSFQFSKQAGQDPFILTQRIKRSDDSISDQHSHLHKEKSMEILRNIKSSLEKQRLPHSQSARPLVRGLSVQRNKILEQITQKLQVKNRVPALKVEKPAQTLQLNKRVAKLETFMQQIKREREMNQKPAIVHEKQKINRINFHMLEQKLAEERKKSESKGKQEIFTSIQEIKGELKNMQKTHDAFLRNPEKKKEDLSEKLSERQPETPPSFAKAEHIPEKKVETLAQSFVPKMDSVQLQQRREVIIEAKPRQYQQIDPHLQPIQPIQPFQVPVFNFYNVVPANHPVMPPLIIPHNNVSFPSAANTDRPPAASFQFSHQHPSRRAKFSLKYA